MTGPLIYRQKTTQKTLPYDYYSQNLINLTTKCKQTARCRLDKSRGANNGSS